MIDDVMLDCLRQHLRMGTARISDTETEEEGEKRKGTWNEAKRAAKNMPDTLTVARA